MWMRRTTPSFRRCVLLSALLSQPISHAIAQAIFYINAPRVLTVLWGMLKGLMDPVTVNKVHITSDGARLLEAICADI